MNMEGGYFLTRKEYFKSKLIFILICVALIFTSYLEHKSIITTVLLFIIFSIYYIFSFLKIKEVNLEDDQLIILGSKGTINTNITNISHISSNSMFLNKKPTPISSYLYENNDITISKIIIHLKISTIYGKKITCFIKTREASPNPLGDIIKYINEEKRKVKEEANKQ